MRIARFVILTGLVLLLGPTDGPLPRPAAANPEIEISAVILTREIVRMDVAPDSVVVRGVYSFRRLGTSHVCPLYFPFPRDSVAVRPRLVNASVKPGTEDYEPLHVNTRQTPWFAEVLTSDADSFTVSLLYSQRVDAARASYPLTSRYPWFIPCEWIQIDVAMLAGTFEPEFSLPFSSGTDGGGTTTYSWTSDGPLPDQDMDLTWHRSVDTEMRGHR